MDPAPHRDSCLNTLASAQSPICSTIFEEPRQRHVRMARVLCPQVKAAENDLFAGTADRAHQDSLAEVINRGTEAQSIHIYGHPPKDLAKDKFYSSTLILSMPSLYSCRSPNTAKTMVFCNFVISCSSDSNSPTLHGTG